MTYSTTDTLSSLIEEVAFSLQGQGIASDQVTTLTSALDDSSTSFSVDSTDNISRGLIEIDDEIMYADYGENGTVYLTPFGRGFKGTVKSAHAAGSPVWIAPTWPRAVVAREINGVIRSLYPDIFGVATVDMYKDSFTNQYMLPDDCERVLAVEWRWHFPDDWAVVDNWEVTHSGQVGEFPSGKTIFLGGNLPTSAEIHITYARLPTVLNEGTQPFTDTGLPATCRDLVVLGAAARLLPWQDTARIPVETVPSDSQDINKPVGLATQVAGTLRQQFALKLASERRALLAKYPTRSHGVR